jgi:hypothetical protein
MEEAEDEARGRSCECIICLEKFPPTGGGGVGGGGAAAAAGGTELAVATGDSPLVQSSGICCPHEHFICRADLAMVSYSMLEYL